jgi:hypothetical protein
MPRKTFVAGEILTAADVNANLMDQAVMTFADAAARTSALPSPSEGMVTFLASTKSIDKRVGSSWVPASNGFTASSTITATDASWPVPSLASPIVKVTVVGGGGGGGGATSTSGSTGGTTTFNAGGAGSISAAGGLGGRLGAGTVGGSTGTAGFASHNGGTGGAATERNGATGGGGTINVAYLNLSGISTVDVTIGAGGAGGTGTTGGAGGRGEVIVEYVAA